MKVLCFSSFNFAYLDRARVLFATLRQHHPDWRLVALVTDIPPPGVPFDLSNESWDEIIYAKDLQIDNFKAWVFKHSVVEACTAVKGPYLALACRQDVEAVVYLDPDIAVFAPLEVISRLTTQSILLTPHQLAPNDDNNSIQDNEITSLATGIYNLGFIGVSTSNEGQRFANWWSDRLKAFCFDDIPRGLFVDQKWCDHVPVFFDGVKIIKDPGYNVASWNLSRRTISFDRQGAALVNGVLLRFWHFTKLGRLGDTMTRRYAKNNYQVFELWNWYKSRVQESAVEQLPKGYWAYGTFEDGQAIERKHRLLYRSRTDLQTAFPDPFASGGGSFQEWLTAHPEEAPG